MGDESIDIKPHRTLIYYLFQVFPFIFYFWGNIFIIGKFLLRLYQKRIIIFPCICRVWFSLRIYIYNACNYYYNIYRQCNITTSLSSLGRHNEFCVAYKQFHQFSYKNNLRSTNALYTIKAYLFPYNQANKSTKHF